MNYAQNVHVRNEQLANLGQIKRRRAHMRQAKHARHARTNSIPDYNTQAVYTLLCAHIFRSNNDAILLPHTAVLLPPPFLPPPPPEIHTFTLARILGMGNFETFALAHPFLRARKCARTCGGCGCGAAVGSLEPVVGTSIE